MANETRPEVQRQAVLRFHHKTCLEKRYENWLPPVDPDISRCTFSSEVVWVSGGHLYYLRRRSSIKAL